MEAAPDASAEGAAIITLFASKASTRQDIGKVDDGLKRCYDRAMTNKGRQLLVEALSLPEADRAALARELIVSLEGPAKPGVEEAWAKEIERRVKELDADPTIGSDWHEAIKNVEEKVWGGKKPD